MISAVARSRRGVLPGDVAATVVLARGDAVVASWPLDVSGPVDLSVVDDLARLHLAARRIGCSIRLREAGPDLAALLAFVGLAEVVTGSTGRPWPLQVGGESEGGEEGGVEEVVVPDDPVA